MQPNPIQITAFPVFARIAPNGFASFAAFALLMFASSHAWAVSMPAPDGAALYTEHCAKCHDTVARAPKFKMMQKLPPEFIMRSLEAGKMLFQGIMRTKAERTAIASYVSEKEFGAAGSEQQPSWTYCSLLPGQLKDPVDGAHWNGWGGDVTNSRFQSAEKAGMTAADIPNLKLKWSFGLPLHYQTSQPTVFGGRVYIGSMDGVVFSMDAKTGCLYWALRTQAGVRSTINVGPLAGTDPPRYVAYFGDVETNMYAVDARTGKVVWKTKIGEHVTARITGGPARHENRLYVGISSVEEATGGEATYECCSFRGSVNALNATTGELVWKSYMIDPAVKVRKNKIGVQLWGPSGAGVWATPTLDLKLKRVYVTTGDNYSDPASLTSDAMMAFEMETGKHIWTRQFTVGDAFNLACESGDDTNCPEARGPDLDFGSSAILRALPDGKRVLLAGQKSGVVHAVDPDQDGKILWQQRAGAGGILGGIQWGPAADAENIYVALSDVAVNLVRDERGTRTSIDNSKGGGIAAYRIADGEKLWFTPPPGCNGKENCSPAQSAAISVLPGVVFSGSVDGHFRAYSTQGGSIVWDYDTAQEYYSVNDVDTKGGSLDGPGPTVADGMLYVYTGYGFWGGMPGNALLAFHVDGQGQENGAAKKE